MHTHRMMMDPGSDVVDDGLIRTPSDLHRLLHNHIQLITPVPPRTSRFVGDCIADSAKVVEST